MKIALIDDERNELDLLSGYLTNRFAKNCEITCYSDGKKFLRNWHSGDFDLIVLDIFIGKLLGVDVAKKIRETDNDVRLVFCTTSNEFAGESYEVDARYYIRKPITEDKVTAMLDRLDLDELELSRAVTMPDGQSLILRNITYAEYSGHSITIHNKRGEDATVRVRLSDAETILCEYPYLFACAKGIIVNFYEIAALDGDVFILKDSSKVPISRRKHKDVTDAYASFRFQQLRKGGEG